MFKLDFIFNHFQIFFSISLFHDNFVSSNFCKRAYGVFLWEIATYGQTPLEGMDVQTIINKVENQCLEHIWLGTVIIVIRVNLLHFCIVQFKISYGGKLHWKKVSFKPLKCHRKFCGI